MKLKKQLILELRLSFSDTIKIILERLCINGNDIGIFFVLISTILLSATALPESSIMKSAAKSYYICLLKVIIWMLA
jgi:hypothetical protein